MRCYYHPDTEAVGVCKNCYKGICRSCAVEVPDGLGCHATCAAKIRRMNELIERNQRVHTQIPVLHKRQARIGFAVGITTCVASLVFIHHLPAALLLLGGGTLMIVGSWMVYVYGKNMETKTLDNR